MSRRKNNGMSQRRKHISLLEAWALAFGCAVGWDAFVLPWTDFLPEAGLVCSVAGIAISALIMLVIAWNFHMMMCRTRGSGGVYTYAKEAFGIDHGFICGLFLAIAYSAIVLADAAAMVVAVNYIFGSSAHFGFRYTIGGYCVCMCDMTMAVVSIATAAAICCRKRLAARVQTVMAIVFILVLFACIVCAVLCGRPDVIAQGTPAPVSGNVLLRLAGIVVFSPWLFVGFGAISNTSAEHSFSPRRSFMVMAAAIISVALVYELTTLISVFVPAGPENASGAANVAIAAYNAVAVPMGAFGKPLMAVAFLCAIFTNLVGNTFAASRLLAHMASDGVLPAWLGRRNADDSPRNAVFLIAVVALAASLLGRTIIKVIVDTALFGAGIAYAYTSAAAFKIARVRGKPLSAAAGFAGCVLSIVFLLGYALFGFFDAGQTMATELFLVIVFWCLAGLLAFLHVFRRDSQRRFGHSGVVWISLLTFMLILNVLWGRKTSNEAAKVFYDDIERFHAESPAYCAAEDKSAEWNKFLRGELDRFNASALRSSLVQTVTALVAFCLLYLVHSIMRRRERDIELEKSKAKSYFFSTVSHDIRTPLNAIIGFSEMLKSAFMTEEERREAIDAVLVSGKTLLGLVNDVLDLSKLEAGKMEIRSEPTDVRALVETIREAFRATNSKAGVEIRSRVEEMPILMADPQRLRQIVFNLAGNAVKFTERGHVEIRARYRKGTLEIAVEDTGCGIDEKDLSIVGHAYVQVGARRGRNGGTGLGLAICRQLATAMGGTLSVESTIGAGSTFTISIPDVAVASAAAAAAVMKPKTISEIASAMHLRNMRILVVDDMPINIKVAKAHLKQLGETNVETASNGVEALAKLRDPSSAPFDLVLTDLWMPQMDGAALAKEIRSDAALRTLRVVAVTADVEQSAAGAQSGFDEVILKPVTTDKLVGVLDRAAKASG